MSSVIAIHSRTSRTRDDWETPECVLERVRHVNVIGVDPCCSRNNVGARWTIDASYDGLLQPWTDLAGGELVYCNPPFGRALKDWSRKIVLEAELGCEIIALTPARPDTQWFEMLWRRARAACFWRGRITFVGAKDPSPFPAMLTYFGPHPRLFASAFNDAGIVEVLR